MHRWQVQRGVDTGGATMLGFPGFPGGIAWMTASLRTCEAGGTTPRSENSLFSILVGVLWLVPLWQFSSKHGFLTWDPQVGIKQSINLDEKNNHIFVFTNLSRNAAHECRDESYLWLCCQ